MAGRPTLYKPEYCESVVEWGKLGKSRTWIASELDVTRDTLYEWERTHPEFSDALTRAKIFEQRWWEDAGQTGMTSDKFNNGVWAKSVSCRFPADWRDKVAHVGGDKDDNPIKQEVSVSADDFTRRISSAAARAAATSGTSDTE